MADGSGADALADPANPTALEALHPLASIDVEIAPALVHREVYTQRGLLSVFHHEPVGEVLPAAIVACGGA